MSGCCCDSGFAGSAAGSAGPPGPAGAGITVNRINLSNVGGTKLIDVVTTPFSDGTTAAVDSVGALFTLVKAPTAALTALADGITVVLSVATPGSLWVRGPNIALERFAANPPAFIDPVGGNDDNDGLLVGTPLKSLPEWCRRTDGASFAASFSVTIAAGNAGAFTPNFSCSTDVSVTVQGTVTSSAVGTIGAFVAQNTAAAANTDGTRSEFTDAGAPAITATSRLRITASATPSHVGLVAFVTSLKAGNPLNPYTTRWQTGSTDPAYNAIAINPSNGDSYVVDTLTTTLGVVKAQIEAVGGFLELRIVDLKIHAIPSVSGFHIAQGNTEGWNSKGVCFYKCRFEDVRFTGFQNSNATYTVCEFTSPVIMSQCVTVLFGCIFRTTLAVFNSDVRGHLSNTFSAVTGITNVCDMNQRAQITQDGDIQWTGCTGGGTGLSVRAGGGAENLGTLWGAENSLATGVKVNGRGSMSYATAGTANVNIPATVPLSIGGTNYVQSDLPVFDGVKDCGITEG